jgi:hypothetical protein
VPGGNGCKECFIFIALTCSFYTFFLLFAIGSLFDDTLAKLERNGAMLMQRLQKNMWALWKKTTQLASPEFSLPYASKP